MTDRVYASFDNNKVGSIINKQPKRKLYQISLNTGPVPTFQKNKPNIAASYKETSDRIKEKVGQNNFHIKQNLPIGQNLNNQKNTMQIPEEFINKKLNEQRSSMLKRNLTTASAINQVNFNTNGNTTNSFQSNFYHNSSLNSVGFTKNTLVSATYDSNSYSKGQLTFTHRNYNESHSTVHQDTNATTEIIMNKDSLRVENSLTGNVIGNSNTVSNLNIREASNNTLIKSKLIAYGNKRLSTCITNDVNKTSGLTLTKLNNKLIKNIALKVNEKSTNSGLNKNLQFLNLKNGVNFKKTGVNNSNVIIAIRSPTCSTSNSIPVKNQNACENNIINPVKTNSVNLNNPNNKTGETESKSLKQDPNKLIKNRSGSNLHIDLNIKNNKIRRDSIIYINNRSKRNNSVGGNQSNNKLINIKSAENIIVNNPSLKDQGKVNNQNVMNSGNNSIFDNNNIKKHSKNKQSISILSIKEKYKELLKNKSIPASLMIKNFKLSTDMGSCKITNLKDVNAKILNKQTTSTRYPQAVPRQNLPLSKNMLSMQNLKSLIQDNCSKLKDHNLVNYNQKNKILSMDVLNSLNILNKHVHVLEQQDLSPHQELLNKHTFENSKEEDGFDDINSIVKKLNFANINVNKENIFSRNNFLYNNFEEKFNLEFDNYMMPNFMELSTPLSYVNTNKTSSRHQDKSLSTQDTSSKKTFSSFTKSSGMKNSKLNTEPVDTVNLFNVHLSKMD